MTQISSTFSATRPTPRIANYVAALIREGDNFDYCEWLEQVREKEAQANRPTRTITERIASGREPSPNKKLFSGSVPIPQGLRRLCRRPLRSASGTPITRRLRKIREAWDEFQANRTRDAVYGYLEVVFAPVKHYKVRRRIEKLLRHASRFANIPFDKDADPFTAVIRCTSDRRADNKTVSKWARALRYASRSKEPAVRLRTFMKRAGGVNACADLYARYFGRGGR
jgi:hypothetical protein